MADLPLPERVAGAIKRLKLRRVIDVLNHFPRAYNVRAKIAELKSGDTATIVGEVTSANNKASKKRGFKLTEVVITDGSGSIKAVFFQQPWLTGRYKPGVRVKMSGPVDYAYGSWTIKPTIHEFAPPMEETTAPALEPEYPLSEGLANDEIAALIARHMALAPTIPDPLPKVLSESLRLMPLDKAYAAIHGPTSRPQLAAAQLSLKYREFFLIQCGLRLRQRSEEGDAALKIDVTDELRTRAIKYFPFEFTGAQKRVSAELERDMTRPGRMHRLIQGDVGSGKTAVALYASLLMIEHGFQAAFMAPTEVLARQHYASLTRYLGKTKVRIALLTGGMKKSERDELLDDLARGRTHVIIGTHALIEDDVKFRRLGLCVIDEQHKFGVNQRADLRRKGDRPHVLAMSATPIPRTLSLTLYGGLDVSVIDELPPGRKPVLTDWVHRRREAACYEKIRAELKAGGRAYFIYPLVEGSEAVEAKSAVEYAEHLKNEIFKEFRVGLVHGQMPSEEKASVMERFRKGEIDILAATVVVEVGVDVPEANIMVIENAERFGLAQIHQLRGRIGRGARQSFLYLFGEPHTQDAIKRLEIICQTTDGFRIAEEDLKMRGFGDFAGTRQSGIPKLHAGDFERDLDVLARARKDAAVHALTTDESLLRRCLELHFGREFRLLDV
ncbi:MAG: ATP-dependent DNA helicase RecG [Planctomycetes bacterium]|nr:ATP-dependent DNA helicase RecG [Planctomycetota bacterium]